MKYITRDPGFFRASPAYFDETVISVCTWSGPPRCDVHFEVVVHLQGFPCRSRLGIYGVLNMKRENRAIERDLSQQELKTHDVREILAFVRISSLDFKP